MRVNLRLRARFEQIDLNFPGAVFTSLSLTHLPHSFLCRCQCHTILTSRMAQQMLLPPPFKRTLSQGESLALVQIFLNASLACIAHSRELIPWTSPCFRTRHIDQINLEDQRAEQSLYSAFQDCTSEQVEGGQEIKILVRGRHRRADQMLDMLVSVTIYATLRPC